MTRGDKNEIWGGDVKLGERREGDSSRLLKEYDLIQVQSESIHSYYVLLD